MNLNHYQRLSMYKILVVDDEPEIVEIIKEMLSANLECIINSAGNGLDAYQQAEREKFDLICTDHRMPIMTGGGLVVALRERENINKQTPILVISGFIAEARQFFETLSDVMFINKPFSEDKLIAAVKRALGVKE